MITDENTHVNRLSGFRRNANHLTAWIMVGGEFLSPDAAGIQTDGVVFAVQTQRRPVAEYNRLVGGFTLGQAKPRQQAVGYVADFPFELKIHRAVGRADAHAGEGVDDDAQAFGATQRIFPVVR